MNSRSDIPSTRTPSRGEWTVIASLTAVALVLRGWNLSTVSVEHFDEAIYASNLLFGEGEGFQYPRREFFAPPLFPFLVECTMIAAGISGTTVMYANVFLGALTVPLLWYVGRSWYGPACGLIAALLAAGSDFHIAFSRSAVTDVSLCFWWLPTVWAYERAFTLRSFKFAIVAGLGSALCWATKYTGWITWLIALTGGLGYVLCSVQAEPLARRLRFWLGICAVSGVTMLIGWYPVWSDLQDVGGYAAIAANHRQYFVGLSGWWESFMSQMKIQRAEQGFLTHFVGFAAGIWMIVSMRHLLAASRKMMHWAIPCLGFITLALAFCWSFSLAFVLLGYGVIIKLLIDELKSGSHKAQMTDEKDATPSRAATWLLGSWSLGMLLATPLYHPYPRLMLPNVVSMWIAFGLCASIVTGTVEQRDRRAVWISVPLALLLAVGGSFLKISSSQLFLAWEPRLAMEQASRSLAEKILNDEPVSRETVTGKEQTIVYVWGEPAVVFHLRSTGWPLVMPVADWGFIEPIEGAPRLPTYLVVGPQFMKSASSSAMLPEYERILRLVGELTFIPSQLVEFDDRPPERFGQIDPPRSRSMRLYRVR